MIRMRFALVAAWMAVCAVNVLTTPGDAMAAETRSCGVFEFTASGGKATKNVVVNLTSLLASEVELTGKCTSVTVVHADEFEEGCGADDACVSEFATAAGLEMVITSGVRFDEKEALVKLRLYEASQGFFVEILQRKVESDPAVLMTHISAFANDLLRKHEVLVVDDEQPDVLVMVEDTDEPIVVDGSMAGDGVAVDDAESEALIEDSGRIDEEIRRTEDGPIELEVSTLEERDRLEVDDEDLAASEDFDLNNSSLSSEVGGPNLLFRVNPRVGIKAFGGFAMYQESFAEVGLDFSFHLKPTVYLDLEVDGWIGTKHQPRSDDMWTYALLPFSLGIGFKGQKQPLVHPYAGLGALGILYYIDPDAQRPHFAVGARFKGGVDLMIKQRFGLFVEGSFGFAYAQNITTLVDEDFWPGWFLFSTRAGVIVQL